MSLVAAIDVLIDYLESQSIMKTNGLFDVAANLSHFCNNYDLVINKALARDVKRFFLSGYTLNSNYSNIELCTLSQYENHLFCGVGIHPYNVDKFEGINIDIVFNELEALILKHRHCKNVTRVIGETGLDFSEHFPCPALQQKWFEKHIELACKHKMKLYLHERLAHQQLIATLEEKYDFPPNDVLIHCVTCSVEELLRYVQRGYNLSVSGYITRKRGKEILHSLKQIPIQQLMIESDAPYMLPSNKRIKKLKLLCDDSQNEPCTLPFVLEAIAEHHHLSVEQIAAQTTDNAVRFFLS